MASSASAAWLAPRAICDHHAAAWFQSGIDGAAGVAAPRIISPHWFQYWRASASKSLPDACCAIASSVGCAAMIATA